MASGREYTIVEVLYPYSAAEPNQISLNPTEKITVLEKDKSGWWIGKRGNGDVGIFPSTYVRVVEDRLKFNRPKELKQLPLGGGGSSGGNGGQTRRNSDDEKTKQWRAELGLDSESDHEDDGKAGEQPEKLAKARADIAKLRKSLDVISTENAKLNEFGLRLEKEKEQLAAETGTIRQQLPVLKKQLALAHEKERRLLLELDDWKQEVGPEGRPPPREYVDAPDAALERWLDTAVQDRLRSANDTINVLKSQQEKLINKLKEVALEGPKEDDDAETPDLSDVSPKGRKKEKSDVVISIEPEEGERPDKHDLVCVVEGEANTYAQGCLKPGEHGTIVEDQGEDSPMPFRVRNADGDDSWYTDTDLRVVERGKRKIERMQAEAGGGRESPAGRASPAPSASGADDSADVKKLQDELKDKSKKLRKMEKRQVLMEEDLDALEKYNAKLEKKLDKLKKTSTPTPGADGNSSPTPQGDDAELLERIAKLEKKNRKLEKNAAASPSPTPASGEVPALPSSVPPEEMDNLKKELEALREESAKQSAESETLQKNLGGEKAGLEMELAEARAVLSESNEHKAEREKQLIQQKEELATIEGKLKAAEEEKVALSKQAADAAALAAEAGARKEEAEKMMANWTAEKNAIEDKLSTTEAQLAQQTEDLTHANARYKKEESRRRTLYNQLMELKGNIRVYCRIRPCPDEVCDNVQLEDDMTLRIKDPQSGKVTPYEFDKCFDQSANQPDIFEEAKGLAVSVLDGFYVCIFAYGQTGSGKTYTMEGPPQDRGVNFRTVSELFKIAQERVGDYQYALSVSVLEVYNDKVYDLQNKRTMCKVIPAAKGDRDVSITPLQKTPVQDADQVITALEEAYTSRKVAGTSMNEHSSRSHCVLTVWVEAKNHSTGQTMYGKLHLVDLAGSERIAKSEVTVCRNSNLRHFVYARGTIFQSVCGKCVHFLLLIFSQGDQKAEAVHINKSLTQLGLCINSLANKKDHIPFRNSQLTTLLQVCPCIDTPTTYLPHSGFPWRELQVSYVRERISQDQQHSGDDFDPHICDKCEEGMPPFFFVTFLLPSLKKGRKNKHSKSPG